MTRDEVFLKIKQILEESIKWKEEGSTIDEQTKLIEEIGLSSLEGLEILVKIENEFDIEIDDEDLSIELMSTLSNLVDYVESKNN